MEGGLVCHPRMLYADKGSVIWERYFRRLDLPGSLRSCMLRHDGLPWEREAGALVAKVWIAMAREDELFELTVRESLTRAMLLVLLYADGPKDQEVPKPSEHEANRIKRMVAQQRALGEVRRGDEIWQVRGVNKLGKLVSQTIHVGHCHASM